jgi:hypothetical protein
MSHQGLDMQTLKFAGLSFIVLFAGAICYLSAGQVDSTGVIRWLVLLLTIAFQVFFTWKLIGKRFSETVAAAVLLPIVLCAAYVLAIYLLFGVNALTNVVSGLNAQGGILVLAGAALLLLAVFFCFTASIWLLRRFVNNGVKP